MSVHVHHIATAVPPATYTQETARDVMTAWIGGDRRTDRLLHRIYGHSGIDTRHSVIGDFSPGAGTGDGGLFVDDAGGFRNPSTAERNARYREEAGPLFADAARRALAGAEGFAAADVTHLVTVSCTGFYAPGPDVELIEALGLRAGTERYHLGFMGCYAAFPALRMARAFCRADPDAVVLVVAAEACSLHLQPVRDVDAIVAASVFADGAAAAIVAARPPTGPALRLDRFADGLVPEGASDMAWTIGDHGFEMVLSSYVPRIVGETTRAALQPLLDGSDVAPDDVRHWAVHPGGRAILDRLQEGLDLDDEALGDSREVLRRNGNMSSATILFVLRRLMRSAPPAGRPVLALAFGPGLTVASGLFHTA